MRILISGSAGFLGREFTKYHVEQGNTVVGVDDLSGRGSHWVSGDYSRNRMDIVDFMASSMLAFDRVYHFAAPVGGRVRIESDPFYNASSLAIDLAMFRWAMERSPVVVYPSSSAVYGTDYQSGSGVSLWEGMFDPAEHEWHRPDQMYGFTKMAGEVLAHHATRYGVSTLCIRPFSGYGEGQSFDYPMPAICRRAARHEDPLVVWGSGLQSRDFIHVSDIVGATEAALALGPEMPQALNIGSGIATSFFEVAAIAAQCAGYDPAIFTDEGKPEGVSARYCDPTRMLELYEPKVTLEAGIARMVEVHQ